MSVFEQSQSDDISLYYRFPIEDDYIKKMIGNLQYIILDPVKKQEMDNEAFWYRHDDMLSGELMRKDERLLWQEAELSKKDNELLKKTKQLHETAQRLKKLGISVEEIAQLTGLSMEEIEEN